MRAPAFVVLCACLSTAAVAQTPVDSTHFPPRGSYPHAVPISARFDAEQGKTILQTDPFPLTPTLSLSILSAIDGPVVVHPPENAVFTFWSTGPSGRFAGNSGVRFILDQADTLDLGRAWLTPQRKPGYTEILLKGSFRGQFLAIVNAKSVTLSVGPITTTLDETQRAVLRDFASRMAPEPRH